MPWFIVPVVVANTGGGTFNRHGFTIQQPKNAVQLGQWIAAGYLGPYKTYAEAQARFNQGKTPLSSQTPPKVKKQYQQATSQPPLPLPDPFGGWLTSLGGMIGSGIESGLVSFFTDLYNVIVGPLEIVLGIIVAIWVLVFIFKDDLAALAPMFLK